MFHIGSSHSLIVGNPQSPELKNKNNATVDVHSHSAHVEIERVRRCVCLISRSDFSVCWLEFVRNHTWTVTWTQTRNITICQSFSFQFYAIMCNCINFGGTFTSHRKPPGTRECIPPEVCWVSWRQAEEQVEMAPRRLQPELIRWRWGEREREIEKKKKKETNWNLLWYISRDSIHSYEPFGPRKSCCVATSRTFGTLAAAEASRGATGVDAIARLDLKPDVVPTCSNMIFFKCYHLVIVRLFFLYLMCEKLWTFKGFGEWKSSRRQAIGAANGHDSWRRVSLQHPLSYILTTWSPQETPSQSWYKAAKWVDPRTGHFCGTRNLHHGCLTSKSISQKKSSQKKSAQHVTNCRTCLIW